MKNRSRVMIGALALLISIGADSGATPAAPDSGAPSGCPGLPPPAGTVDPSPDFWLVNRGEVDPSVTHYIRNSRAATFFTKTGELVYLLPAADGAALALRETHPGSACITPQGEGRVNTLITDFRGTGGSHGGDISAWVSLDCGEIHPGIKLELKAAHGSIEKIYHLAPGADHKLIALHLEGADRRRLADDGRLLAISSLGKVAFSAPVAWQDGPRGRQEVEVAYDLKGDHYGFALGVFDPALPLVIDPLLASTLLGGATEDQGLCALIGAQNDVYIAGYSFSADLPTTVGVLQEDYSGNRDVFIARFTSDLTELLACTYLGGSQQEEAGGWPWRITAISTWRATATPPISQPPRGPIRRPATAVLRRSPTPRGVRSSSADSVET